MAVRRLLKGAYGKEIYVSYLPLSHIAAQMLDLIIPLKHAYAVYFAEPDALKVRHDSPGTQGSLRERDICQLSPPEPHSSRDVRPHHSIQHAYAVYFAQPDALTVRHDNSETQGSLREGDIYQLSSPESHSSTNVRPHHSTPTCLRCLLCLVGCSEGKT